MKKVFLGQWFLSLVAVSAATACEFGTAGYDNHDNAAQTAQDLGISCGALQDCEPYRACVTGGTVQCQNNRCLGIGMVDLECVIKTHDSATVSTSSTPAASMACGQVGAPPEAIAKCGTTHANCDRLANAMSYFAYGKRVKVWVDVTADTPDAIIEVVSLTLYGVLSNKTVVPIASGVTWNGIYWRSPWFKDASIAPNYGRIGDATQVSASTYVLVVPSNPTLLHFGNEGAVIAAPYVDYFAVGEFRATNAKVQVGVDIWNGSTYDIEMGSSNWFACSSGTVTAVSYNSTLSNPCSNQIGTIAATSPTASTPVSTPTATPASTSTATTPTAAPTSTPAPTASSACPFATGLFVEPAAALLSWCSTVQVVTWDKAGILHAGSPGMYFHEAMDVTGIAAFSAMCGNTYRPATAWPAAGSSAATAGFGKICSQGVDITAKTIVCSYGNGLKLAVAADPIIAGQCQ